MLSIQTFARLTGLLYLLLVPLGYFGIGFVPGLEVPGDIAATIGNLIANESYVHWAVFSAISIQVIHFALVLFLYKLLHPVNQTIARVMVLLVMVGVPIAMLNEATYGGVLSLLDTADESTALISLLLALHHYGVMIVQIFWGLWLFPLGYLIFKSTFIPKLIGVTLMIGCFGYVFDSFVYLIDPNFPITLSIYLFWGEMFLTFWLLIMGVNAKNWQQTNAN